MNGCKLSTDSDLVSMTYIEAFTLYQKMYDKQPEMLICGHNHIAEALIIMQKLTTSKNKNAIRYYLPFFYDPNLHEDRWLLTDCSIFDYDKTNEIVYSGIEV